MEYSRGAIRDAVTWDGNTAIDGTPADWYYEVLEKADPDLVAAVRQELAQEELYAHLSLRDCLAEQLSPKGLRESEEERERKYMRSLPFHFIQD